MKNLKKLSRNELKTLKGSGSTFSGDHFIDPNLDTNECEQHLMFCQKLNACVAPSFYTKERCIY